MLVKITAIKRTDRVSKAGRPFVSLGMKVEQYGDKWISGFGGDENREWKVGDEVDVEIETKENYLNFKTLKSKPQVNGDISRVMNYLEFKVMERLQHIHDDVRAIHKAVVKNGYPQMDETNDAHMFDEPDIREVTSEDSPFN